MEIREPTIYIHPRLEGIGMSCNLTLGKEDWKGYDAVQPLGPHAISLQLFSSSLPSPVSSTVRIDGVCSKAEVSM